MFLAVTYWRECVHLGIGLNILSAPLHEVRLQSEFIQGEVIVGVRPTLPIEGVHIVLGNRLVGECVWADSYR